MNEMSAYDDALKYIGKNAGHLLCVTELEIKLEPFIANAHSHAVSVIKKYPQMAKHLRSVHGLRLFIQMSDNEQAIKEAQVRLFMWGDVR